MGCEEELMQAEAKVAELTAKVSGLEAVIDALFGVLTDAQFGQVRAQLDALDVGR
jgi:uncharacterized coiled-coil protein SlyX